ncbi:hypothetical protein BASA61_004993 [Batrachochytrium salamandrivorans]|nr:hypothetical protein BASA60_009609 [Batrachochytrium salamandrivorans]KAH6591285.1 hypothetical protein BASA61_004993 [Batrachochytrium salamandrivorans]
MQLIDTTVDTIQETALVASGENIASCYPVVATTIYYIYEQCVSVNATHSVITLPSKQNDDAIWTTLLCKSRSVSSPTCKSQECIVLTTVVQRNPIPINRVHWKSDPGDLSNACIILATPVQEETVVVQLLDRVFRDANATQSASNKTPLHSSRDSHQTVFPPSTIASASAIATATTTTATRTTSTRVLGTSSSSPPSTITMLAMLKFVCRGDPCLSTRTHSSLQHSISQPPLLFGIQTPQPNPQEADPSIVYRDKVDMGIAIVVVCVTIAIIVWVILACRQDRPLRSTTEPAMVVTDIECACPPSYSSVLKPVPVVVKIQ